jgi:two-component system, cell cycle response regulator DivK
MVVVVVPDLFFATRIESTAKLLGVRIRPVDIASALATCRSDPPELVILDLHAAGDPVALARELKSDPATREIPIVAFYSHVQNELRELALAAGIDRVMPRSAFTARLPEIFAGRETKPPATPS